jgi:DNA-binding response OmpR family regulator
MSRMLLCETQDTLAVEMNDYFPREHYDVERETNGLKALEILLLNHYDIVILEMVLEGLAGLSIVRSYRACGGSTPVLILSGEDSAGEMQLSLGAGDDAYLLNSFCLKDLAAQLRAMLRRPDLRDPKVLTAGNIAMDIEARAVTRDCQPVHLHPMDFKLLLFLMQHPNKTFDSQAILQHVWQKKFRQVDLATVRTHVRTLRHKIDSPGKRSIDTGAVLLKRREYWQPLQTSC